MLGGGLGFSEADAIFAAVHSEHPGVVRHGATVMGVGIPLQAPEFRHDLPVVLLAQGVQIVLNARRENQLNEQPLGWRGAGRIRRGRYFLRYFLL